MDNLLYTDEMSIETKRFDGIEVKTVIIVTITKGNGTNQNPTRASYLYFDIDGNYITEVDHWLEAKNKQM